MIVTIVIIGILAAVAFPSYDSLVQNYRARTLSTELTTTLSYARSEAVKRAVTVSVCSTGNASFTACGSADDWQNGWIVFIDPNNDGVIDSTNDRLKIKGALETGSNLTSTRSKISFDSRGFSEIGNTTFNVSAPNCTGNHGRNINISATGRVAVTEISC